MTLHDRILSELVQAMKEKNVQKLAVLRMVKAALLVAAKEKPKDAGEKLTDEEVVAILKREAKKRKESAEAFTAGDRVDLAENEQAELVIIQEYLPAQMSEADIRAVVEGVIAEKGTDNFGAVMGAAMEKLKGQADGGVVRSIVNQCMKPQ
jgi:uncharacterized protein YqeY